MILRVLAFIVGLFLPIAAHGMQQSVKLSANGVSTPLAIDLSKSSCGVAILINISSGAGLTASVQVTGDAVAGNGDGPWSSKFGNYGIAQSWDPSQGNWNTHDTLKNLTSSANGNLILPITAVRLSVSGWSSGTAVLTVIENDICAKS